MLGEQWAFSGLTPYFYCILYISWYNFVGLSLYQSFNTGPWLELRQFKNDWIVWRIFLFWNWRAFSLACSTLHWVKKNANFKVNKFLRAIQPFLNCLYSKVFLVIKDHTKLKKPVFDVLFHKKIHFARKVILKRNSALKNQKNCILNWKVENLDNVTIEWQLLLTFSHLNTAAAVGNVSQLFKDFLFVSNQYIRTSSRRVYSECIVFKRGFWQ